MKTQLQRDAAGISDVAAGKTGRQEGLAYFVNVSEDDGMSKTEKKKTKKTYEERRKRAIAVVCVLLAGMFLLWTVAGTVMFSFGAEL